jgi:outer membrane immunogenic protein
MFNAYNNNQNNFVFGNSSQSNNKIGFIGGAQIGYNWQFGGPLLLGLEADFNGHSSISSNNSVFGFGGGNSGSGFLGTGRARLGFLVSPQFLVYATGGVAYGNPWSSANNSAAFFLLNPGVPFFGFNNNQNNFKVGWTGGGGFEYMFTPNWSVKAEYLYVDLGRQSSNFAFFGNGAARSTAHVARLGVNYHFNWGAPAPVVARY